MAIESEPLMMRTGLAWTVVAAMVLFSQSTSAEPPSTGDHQQLRSEMRSATIADSGLVPPASGPVSTNDRRPAKPRDDWDRANQLLAAAQAGDRDAQYRLFATIENCENEMDFYFTKQGEPLTLDEGLEKAAKVNREGQAREWFDRCREFRVHNATAELGGAKYWLERATQSGQPLAQAITAERKLMLDFDEALEQLAVEELGGPPTGAFAVVNFVGPAPDPRAVALLRAAVTSLEPGVLEIIGRAQHLLHPSARYPTANEMAWEYVACQRGLDCSAKWERAYDCPEHCDMSTPEGIIMAWSRDEWPAVQQSAKEINAKLNAGKWDELGLGR